MKKTPWIIGAAAACVVAVVGGGGTAYAISNEVTVNHYGETSTVRVFKPTVAELLASEGIEVKDTDLVIPELQSHVDNGTEIQVIERRPVTVNIDGKAQDVLTTGTTVEDALADLDFERANARITPEPSDELDADGNQVQVVTEKTVTFVGQYGEATFEVTALTVGEAMHAVLQDIQQSDTADVNRQSILKDGATIRVQRVRERERTETEEIPFETTTKEDESLTKGTTKVETEGKKGSKEKVLTEVLVDGKVTHTQVVSENVTAEPVNKVVLKGTKPEPKPANNDDATAASSSSSSSSRSGGGSSSSSDTDQGGEGVGEVNTCQASHYGLGDGFDGGPTASGERFDRNAMTAAHKTLPMGTRIRVTNTANGKSVVVRINDRGPYAGGRCLDLSSGAFSQIAPTSQGVATVTWQRVG